MTYDLKVIKGLNQENFHCAANAVAGNTLVGTLRTYSVAISDKNHYLSLHMPTKRVRGSQIRHKEI